MVFLDFPEIDTGQFQNAPKRIKTERYWLKVSSDKFWIDAPQFESTGEIRVYNTLWK